MGYLTNETFVNSVWCQIQHIFMNLGSTYEHFQIRLYSVSFVVCVRGNDNYETPSYVTFLFTCAMYHCKAFQQDPLGALEQHLRNSVKKQKQEECAAAPTCLLTGPSKNRNASINLSGSAIMNSMHITLNPH